MTQGRSSVEGELRRDCVVVLAGIVIISALAWAYPIHLTSRTGMMGMAMDMAISMQTWTVIDLALLFVMWSVMMIAMMVPTATPIARSAHRSFRTLSQTVSPINTFLIGWDPR